MPRSGPEPSLLLPFATPVFEHLRPFGVSVPLQRSIRVLAASAYRQCAPLIRLSVFILFTKTDRAYLQCESYAVVVTLLVVA